jgi:hypothetical protein
MDRPVGVQSSVVNASFPSNRAAEWWCALFALRGAPLAVRPFLRGAWAAYAEPDLLIPEEPWRKLSVLMMIVATL